MTSKKLVLQTLQMENKENRVPRQMWLLPWAFIHHADEVSTIQRDFPDDIVGPYARYEKYPVTKGDPTKIGEYVDDWGCRFVNLQEGVIGEVKEPLVSPDDEDWSDTSAIHIPYEWLTLDTQSVNDFCRTSDKFITSGCCPRPFEQLQFIRGTENLYIDLMTKPSGMMDFISKMHEYYCELLTIWAKTDVDALMMMDDWGSQKSLLINPSVWVDIFKPMYKDYIDIAHRYGKKMFMHSDGDTHEIIPHLIELGLDAFNTQLFCMGVESLSQYKGKLTFWGEIDRQHLLPKGSIQDIDNAVQLVWDTLWQDGGCIAQCEFGAGANPANVYRVYEKWNSLR